MINHLLIIIALIARSTSALDNCEVHLHGCSTCEEKQANSATYFSCQQCHYGLYQYKYSIRQGAAEGQV